LSTRWSHLRRGRHRTRPLAFGSNGERPSDSPETRAQQLRVALQALGPRYSCFALYLSSRIDLLPAQYCRELALVEDASPPIPVAQVHQLLVNELGDSFVRSFQSFAYQAETSTLLHQSHSALLTTGDRVSVTFLRPEYHGLENDRSLKEFLDQTILGGLGGDLNIQSAVDDFLQALQRKSSFSLKREALESDAQNNHPDGYASVRERKIYHELSTARVLTLEKVQSRNLDQILASRKHSLGTLARRICKAWLTQAMSGHPFPVDPQAHHLVIDEDDQIHFEGCELVTLPKAVLENLWHYLLAALVDDPDRSATYLLQEMYAPRRKDIDLQSFRTNFRQAAYFAALEPILGTDSNALAQLIFQHWKTALEHGYFAKPLLLCFYRGLFSAARIARKVSATDDALREGMEDLQAEKVFNQIRELAGVRYWMQNADKFAKVLVNLPRTFDRALTRTSHPPQEIVIQDGSEPGPRNLGVVIPVFLLIVALLIAEATQMSGSTEKIVTLVLMLAGLLALRALSG
jgi:predicted unusual protein kinase regulating ubiquinone biosynthesis (AarF/ABC1/UbiB family)